MHLATKHVAKPIKNQTKAVAQINAPGYAGDETFASANPLFCLIV
jgi:hypothetical protein